MILIRAANVMVEPKCCIIGFSSSSGWAQPANVQYVECAKTRQELRRERWSAGADYGKTTDKVINIIAILLQMIFELKVTSLSKWLSLDSNSTVAVASTLSRTWPARACCREELVKNIEVRTKALTTEFARIQ